MIWFKHDTNAVNDAKVKKLIIRYGAEGYAIYFHCIELISGDINENNITFCLEHDSEIIADNLKIKGTAEKSGIQIVEEIMKYIVELKLFEEHNNLIYCFKILKRLDLSMTSNVKFRKIITEAKESHDLIMTESCNIKSHEITSNNIKSDNKDDIEILLNFEQFWSLYDKKIEREKCFKKWHKIKPDTYPIIFDHVERYVKSTPDKQYRKNPETYLNNCCWNDEILNKDLAPKQSLKEKAESLDYLFEKKSIYPEL